MPDMRRDKIWKQLGMTDADRVRHGSPICIGASLQAGQKDRRSRRRCFRAWTPAPSIEDGGAGSNREGAAGRSDWAKPARAADAADAAPSRRFAEDQHRRFRQSGSARRPGALAERVKGADKLLHLKVDIGEPQPRTIVAGIAEAYPPGADDGPQGGDRRQSAAAQTARASNRTA